MTREDVDRLHSSVRMPAQRSFAEGDVVRARPVAFAPEADHWVTGRLRVVESVPDDPWALDLVWICDGSADEPVVVDSTTLEHVSAHASGDLSGQHRL